MTAYLRPTDDAHAIALRAAHADYLVLAGGNFKKAPLDAARLRVVGCGDGQAIAVWGPLGLEGREVWNWKMRRDRRPPRLRGIERCVGLPPRARQGFR